MPHSSDDTPNPNLGILIRQLRQADPTQGLKELAAKMGFSIQTLSQFELGARRVADHHLPTFARLLKVPMHVLKAYHGITLCAGSTQQAQFLTDLNAIWEYIPDEVLQDMQRCIKSEDQRFAIEVNQTRRDFVRDILVKYGHNHEAEGYTQSSTRWAFVFETLLETRNALECVHEHYEGQVLITRVDVVA